MRVSITTLVGNVVIHLQLAAHLTDQEVLVYHVLEVLAKSQRAAQATPGV